MFVNYNTYFLNFNKENSSYKNINFAYNLNEGNNFMINRNIYNISFSELKNKKSGEYVKLKSTIEFKIEIDKNGFYYSNEEYNIFAFGETQRDVEDDVFDEFMIQYNFYTNENDNDLDKNARILKYKLLKIYGGKNA